MTAIVPRPAPYNSRLTVKAARENLFYITNPNDPNDPRFLAMLNEACERIINSGKWKGVYAEVTFYYQNYGYIWLPAEYQSIIGMRYKCVPAPTFTQQYQYFENGPGEVDSASHYPGLLIDMGDGYPTQYDASDMFDIANLASWRVYSNALDDGKTLRIFGKTTNGSSVTPYEELVDASGNPGIEVTLEAPYVTLTIPSTGSNPTVITGVQKDVTADTVLLKAVDADDNLYTVGMYEPRDVTPMFRRYQVGTMDNSSTDDAVKVLCQRRFLPLVAETDWVIPGNLSALRQGLRSLIYDEANEDELADGAWGKCLQRLNEESRTSRGAGRPLVGFEIFGQGTPIPTAN